MLHKNEDSFAKAFKQAPPSGVYLLYGAEGYLVDVWQKKIVSKVCGDDSAFNFQKLDGRRLDPDLLFDATESMPLMADVKCVLLDDLDSKITPENLAKLEELLSDLNPACVLVISCKSQFEASSAAGKKIIKLVEKYGTAAEFGARGADGLQKFIASVAKKQGAQISPQVSKYILDTVPTDMNTLTQEVAKICAYAGGGEVTAAHVDAVASPKIEAKVFDLSKYILAKNSQKAFEVLANLFYLRESPVAIVAVLIMSYVDLYRARIARDEGANAAAVTEMFAYKSAYRVSQAFQGKLSSQSLRQCLAYLYDCDLKMKSTSLDDEILLEQTVAKLIAAR